MGSTWPMLLDSVLRPARPDLPRCLAERELHRAARRSANEAHAQELAECERRINQARARVFAADDGVVGARMTELERQWRQLARRGAEAGVMDLWARLAPATWLDRKRFRDSPRALWADAAVALAADVENVERAEHAALELVRRLRPFGEQLAQRVRFRLAQQDPADVEGLLAGALRATHEACPPDQRAFLLARSRLAELRVRTLAEARLPERPLLARDIAHAARVDCAWRYACLPDRENPVAPLYELWQTGYVLSEADASWLTLELPPLPAG